MPWYMAHMDTPITCENSIDILVESVLLNSPLSWIVVSSAVPSKTSQNILLKMPRMPLFPLMVCCLMQYLVSQYVLLFSVPL